MMNLNALTCPSQQQLAAFVAGRLNLTESTEIEQHLEDCESCCQLLKMLPQEDTLVSLLRDPQAETANEGEQRPLSPQHAATMPPTGEQLTLPPSDDVTAIADAAERDAAASLPEPLRDHSRYRITAILGRGGMGDVYKAHHRMMNRPVALKVINAQLVNSHAAVQRFHREVQAAARLTHPNIVTAFDAEQAGDTHYLVMEYVDGVELADVIKDRGPLPVAEACDYISQAALGLQHAHEQGMVHRDIKPQNLMLTSAGVVKILDLGLANLAGAAAEEVTQHESTLTSGGLLDGRLTQLGSMMGTPDYMAPEQADDAHSADIRADIYSLGCTLYCLLAGEAPFSAGSAADKLQSHSQQAARPLSEIRDDVPAELEAVIARMMHKSPAERYQVPLDVAKALEPFVGKPSPSGHAASKPTVKSEPSSNLPLAIVVTLLLGFFIALAGVIVVMTDQGRMVIQSEVGDVQVVVKQNGEEITTIDSKTGTRVKWLATGEYEVELVGGDNDVKLDQTGFRMTRLGKVIVTARWNGEGSGVIRSFTTDDATISQDNVEVADGGWKITATDTQAVRLFEVPMPPMNAGPFFYRAKLKTENVQGRAYLEMWVRFPGQGEFFSKGFHLALNGTNGWAEYEIPFLLEKGQQPDLAKLNLTIEGGGTVWIKDVEVRGRPQISAAIVPDDAKTSAAGRTDHDRLQGKWVPISVKSRGEDLTAEQLARMAIELNGDRATFTDPDSGFQQTGRVSIDATRSPKHIDFIAPDASERMAGILEFDGEQLKLAWCDGDYARPTDFESAQTPDHMTAVLKRVPGSVPATLPQDEPAAAPVLDEPQQQVVKAAEAYLSVVDEGKFGSLRDMVSSWAKQQVTREQVSQTYQKLRDTFGKATHRSLHRVQVYDEFPGLPKGRYALVQYKSDFERQKGLWESLLLNLDADGQWRVNTYANTLEAMPFPEAKPDPATEQKKQAALTAAQQWLKLVDAGNYGESWETSAKINKDGIAKQKLVDAYNELFKPLGRLNSRALTTNEYKTQMPRAPVGEYAVIQFSTQFTHQRVIETVVLTQETDGQWRVSGYFHADAPPPAPNQTPPPRKTGILTNPPSVPAGGLPTGKNLIIDSSLEDAAVGSLPKSWSAWLNDGPDFKCEVVEGGVTGKHCLQISGTGTRGVVFCTSIPLDRTKRYALKGRVKVEGEAGTWAVVKLNYFNSSGWLGVDDRVGVTTSDLDWKLFEKTDAIDKYPSATLIVPTCHIEGNGTAWFDELEVIAYDRDELPADFDATHGKNNRMK